MEKRRQIERVPSLAASSFKILGNDGDRKEDTKRQAPREQL